AGDDERAAWRLEGVADELVLTTFQSRHEVALERRHPVLHLVRDEFPLEDLELGDLAPGVGDLEHDRTCRDLERRWLAAGIRERPGDAALHILRGCGSHAQGQEAGQCRGEETGAGHDHRNSYLLGRDWACGW